MPTDLYFRIDQQQKYRPTREQKGKQFHQRYNRSHLQKYAFRYSILVAVEAPHRLQNSILSKVCSPRECLSHMDFQHTLIKTM